MKQKALNKKKQYEYVIEAMAQLGGYATLGQLYQKVDSSSWGTKNPTATIRRILQDRPEFFRIRAGLWALESHRQALPKNFSTGQDDDDTTEAKQLNHYFYQGLLLTVGNLKRMQTYVPAQDRKKEFSGSTLGQIATISKIFSFTYDHIVRHAQQIDVLWFNERKMPAYAFEIEHTTDMRDALVKFSELQDFNLRFYIVADTRRKSLFDDRLEHSAFRNLRDRVHFLDYDKVIQWHDKQVSLSHAEDQLSL